MAHCGAAFFDGLTAGLDKLAEAATHRKVQVGSKTLWVDKRVSVVTKLPKDSEEKIRKLDRLLLAARRRSKGRIIGAHHVAFPVGQMRNPEKCGFSATHWAVPLPDEDYFTKTWRRGRLHIHKVGPMYVIHKDSVAPGGITTPIHVMAEGLPSAALRLTMGKRKPVVMTKRPE